MDQPKLVELGDQNDSFKIKDVVALEITKKLKEKKNGTDEKLKEIVKEHLSLTNVDSEQVQIPKPNDLGNSKDGNLVKLQSVKLKEDKEEAEKKDDNTKEKRKEIGEKNQKKMKMENGSSTSSSSNDDTDDEIHDKKKHQSVSKKERKVTALQTDKTKKIKKDTEEKNKDKKKNKEKKKGKRRKEASSSSESDEDIHDKKSKSPLQHLQSNKWIWLGALGSLLVLIGGAVLKVMNTQKSSQAKVQEQQTSEEQQRTKKQRAELCISCRTHLENPINGSESTI